MDKFSSHNWLNTKTMIPKYGICVQIDGKWLHVSENGEPLLYDDVEARDAKINELNERDLQPEDFISKTKGLYVIVTNSGSMEH